MSYSLKWAIGVLNRYCEQHARGTYIVFKKGGINTRQVLQSLILGAPAWEEFKKVVKMLEHSPEWLARIPLGGLEPQELGALDQLRVSLCTVQTCSSLDKQIPLCFY